MRALFFAVLLMLPTVATAQVPGDLDTLRRIALEAVNRERTKAGRLLLRRDPILDRVALDRALDLLANGYSKEREAGLASGSERYVAAGGAGAHAVGEHLGRCSGCGQANSRSVIAHHNDWLRSPVHHNDMLSADYERFGFAIVRLDDVEFAVRTFAGPGADDGPAIDAERALAVAAAALRDAGVAVTGSPALQRITQDFETLEREPDMEAMGAALDREGWSAHTVASLRCNGCGRRVTVGTVERFVARLVRGGRLLPGATDAGFAVLADGEGGKRATVVLAKRP